MGSQFLTPFRLLAQAAPETMSPAELIAAAVRIGMTADVAEIQANGIGEAYARAHRRGTFPDPFSIDWLRKERAALMRSSPLPYTVALALRIIDLGLVGALPPSEDDDPPEDWNVSVIPGQADGEEE